MMKGAIILLAALVAVQARPQIVGLNTFDNCGETNPLVMNSLSISPDPVLIPGNVTFSTSITGSVDINSPTPGVFTVSHLNSTTGKWDDVPCFDAVIPVGSCNYDDVCEILNTVYPPADPCPAAFDQGTCHCPFKTGTTTVSNAQITITNTFTNLEDGTYNVKLELYQDTGKTVKLGCINIQADLKKVPQ